MSPTPPSGTPRVPGVPGVPGVPRPTTPPGIPASDEPWWLHALRRVAAVVSAGMLVGAVVLGGGGRLAMLVLASLNPQVPGQLGGDGWVVGPFDLGTTVGLVGLSMVIGVAGGLAYLAIRPLRAGPPWLQRTAIVGGPTIVAAALLLRTDRLAVTTLEPRWLALGVLFGLPLAATWGLVTLSETWLARDSWFRRGSPWRALLALPGLLPLPLVPLLALAALVRFAAQRSHAFDEALSSPVIAWLVRLALLGVVVVALVDLVGGLLGRS